MPEAPDSMDRLPDEIDSRQQEDTRGNITLLGLVSLLNDASSEIIQPILPLFIAGLGGSGIAVGLIGGISDGIPSILKIFSGFLSDAIGRRKPLVLAGYGLSAFAKIFFPLSTAWQHVFLLKTLERSGKGIRSAPRDAIVADSATLEARGRGFGILRALDTSGAVIGSVIAYILWAIGLDFRAMFVIAAAVALLAFIPLMWVREVIRTPSKRLYLGISDGIAALAPEERYFMAAASVFALANFSYMFFILRAQQLFSGSMAIGAPLLLYVLFNVVYAAMAIPCGILSDRIGRRRMLAGGYMLFALVAACFAAVSSEAGFVPLFMLYGLVFAMIDGSQSAFVSDLSCAESRCSSLGLYYGAVGICSIISGVIAGGIWEYSGPTAAFLLSCVLAALASLAMWRMKEAVICR